MTTGAERAAARQGVHMAHHLPRLEGPPSRQNRRWIERRIAKSVRREQARVDNESALKADRAAFPRVKVKGGGGSASNLRWIMRP